MASFLTRVKRAATTKREVIETPTSAPAGVAIGGDVALFGAVTVAFRPIGDIAVGVDTYAVVATNPVDRTVVLLDPSGQVVEATVELAGEPFAAVVANDRAYITTTSDTHDAVEVVDTVAKTAIASYPLAFTAATLAVSPNGKRVYAGRTAEDHVDIAVIDTTAERVGTIDVATGPGIGIDAVRVDPSGRRVYAATTDARGSKLVVINAETTRVESTLRVSAPIRDLAVGPDGTVFVLTSDRHDGGSIAVVDLDTTEIIDTIRVGLAPTQMALSPDGTRAYVVDYDEVAVVSTVTSEIVDAITVEGRPSAVTVSSGGDLLYVADYAGGVTTLTVSASTMPLTYSHFVATAPVAAREIRRELAPA